MTITITAFERSPDGGKTRCEERLPLVKDRACNRLRQISACLGDADWLIVVGLAQAIVHAGREIPEVVAYCGML